MKRRSRWRRTTPNASSIGGAELFIDFRHRTTCASHRQLMRLNIACSTLLVPLPPPTHRAACYQRLGRYLLAAADCRAMLALHDAHPKALFRLGQALVGSRQLEQAVEALGGAARLTPNDVGVRGEGGGQLEQARGCPLVRRYPLPLGFWAWMAPHLAAAPVALSQSPHSQ